MIAMLVLVAAGLSLAAAPPGWSDKPINLRYFPKETTKDELIVSMRKFAFALGVACTHCHGTEEQTGFNLQGVDFSLDIKPQKTTAREMLRVASARPSRRPARNSNCAGSISVPSVL